jgi:hypothetical protein
MATVISVLAILSASAAAGMRIGWPLLIIALLYGEIWSDLPILSRIHPQIILAILISWSLFELFGSKKLLGQRITQLVQLLFSPLVGALMAVTVSKMIEFELHPVWIIGLVGGILAFVIKLVQVGWFFRLLRLSLWSIFSEDILCIVLVLFAFNAPQNGGLIALMLLWIVIRSSTAWRRWTLEKPKEE